MTKKLPEISIKVTTEYIDNKSTSDDGYYIFSYQMDITNKSDHTIQLMGRHWLITNGNGEIEEIKGPGVVGQQPVIMSGETYTYTSFCPLTTPIGTMEGSYTFMEMDNKQHFDIPITIFQLCSDDIQLH